MRNLSLTKIALSLFFLIAISYGLYEARGQIFGPGIELAPTPSPTQDPFITLTGSAKRIATLSMNGRPIGVTEDGSFSESYVLAPGYNRIVFDAQDAYGHKTQRIVEIMYDGPSLAALSTSSSPTSRPATTSGSTVLPPESPADGSSFENTSSSTPASSTDAVAPTQ